VDIVAFGAHPDDVEILAGGLLALSVRQGREVGIVHMTRGERATRGNPEERRKEALEAAGRLGVGAERVTILDLGDTLLENTPANRLEVVRVLRQWRPRIVLHHHPHDRHPDHRKSSVLVADAFFYAGLSQIETGQPPHRPSSRLLFFNNTIPDESPSFVVDVTETFQQKIQALRAYESQLYNPDYPGTETYISSPEYFEQIEVRARHFGGLVGVRYGEPYRATSPLVIRDLSVLF
jgi:bacillithiol biosynthesis deacetylase BshB1